jgi:hypothetical protein
MASSLRRPVSGEQLAQVDNPDPFAVPVWRSPVYRTPHVVIWTAQLMRLIWRVVRFAAVHPLVDATAGLLVFTWLKLGWPGLATVVVALVLVVSFTLIALRLLRPDWFTRFVTQRARDKWRWWYYRRRWQAAMTLAGLAPTYRQRVLLPVLVRVRALAAVDLVTVRMVTGQAPDDFADCSGNLAHAFVAQLCRVREAGPGSVTLEFVRADTLAYPIPALPVWALDPKRMELSFGRGLFARYADQAAGMVELLEAAVGVMHDRAAQFGGQTRTFTPSAGFPFLVVLIDELAFLTAYQPDRDLRKRTEAAIATLTSQGRSVGVCVVGALQDPRKDVISLRNLFPTRIALRLDESDQVDMVLGDGARDRGALADQISPLPETGAGVGYVRLEGSPEPVRVRAAYVTDEDIRAMAAAATSCRPLEGGDLA